MCDKKCKNIECNSLVEKNRTYCSLTCRNIYVNKYLRDYSKNGLGLSKKDDYDKAPKSCKKCDKNLPYKKRNNNFCNSSCSATFNNKGKEGCKYNMSKEGILSLKKSIFKLNNTSLEEVENKMNNYYLNPKKCKKCKKDIEYKKRNKIEFCSRQCVLEYRRKDMSEFQKYKRDCLFSFNLSDYEEEFNFKLIEVHGWYKPVNRGNNLNGVSRDHIYSIRDGFDNSIEPKLIAHPANCKLILQKQNSSKHKRSDITIKELEDRIRNWKLKYNE